MRVRTWLRGTDFLIFLVDRTSTTSQTVVRVVIIALLASIAVSAFFDLDLVLGAFAAGFILRYVLPKAQKLSIAFYSTTALPLIVAVTKIATDAGVISSTNTSVLVAAGAVTVFLMPLLSLICSKFFF